jgi:hypothetical protein
VLSYSQYVFGAHWYSTCWSLVEVLLVTVNILHCSILLYIQWNLGSRTIRFTNQFSEQKTPRMTNGVSDYERASWQQRQADSFGVGVSCWLTLAQYTFLLDFGLRTFRFTNGLQERIKFVNWGSTLYFRGTLLWQLRWISCDLVKTSDSVRITKNIGYYLQKILTLWFNSLVPEFSFKF